MFLLDEVFDIVKGLLRPCRFASILQNVKLNEILDVMAPLLQD